MELKGSCEEAVIKVPNLKNAKNHQTLEETKDKSF